MPPGSVTAGKRLIGIHEVFDAAGVEIAGARVCRRWLPEYGFAATKDLLESERPRALVCYPGVPAAVVAEFAGHRVAGLPFFAPETVTTDHGAVYKNHHLVEAQRVIGTNVLPARVLRPTDKQAVERAFGSVRSLLLEHLPGYTGVDVSDRGADPEGDAVLTVEQMEHVIATWVVHHFTDRRCPDYASDLR